MSYDDVVESLIAQLLSLDYVQKFQQSEGHLRAEAELFEKQSRMKELQKEAVLYRQIGKMEAFKASSHEAQKIEKELKNNALVEDYFLKMQDVNDLLQYVTGEIESRVNILLENDEN
ncbi:YlbF family regulator [Lactococcus nasutitermitis]|uniref:YlbF family regulator n=1 Tax=Lactococcus nasutitermitis TaxID=1652957 RepID=A0ABV9JI70_9LACT|nr:YlbF family regulator [Lactococcus nasutitermitis]